MAGGLDRAGVQDYTVVQQRLNWLETMNIAENWELQQAAVRAVQVCLAGVPFVRGMTYIVEEEYRSQMVFLVTLAPGGRRSYERVLVAEVNASGQPRFARQASALLQRQDAERGAVLLFVAPYISDAAAAICREAGVNYLDFAGNCRFSFDGVFIERQGYPNPHKRAVSRVGLYAPRAERVLRVLLDAPERAWQVRGLASESGVSVGTVVDVRRLLLDREWLTAEREGVRLTQPAALLGEWARQYDDRRNQAHDFYSLQSVAETESAVAEACRDAGVAYGLTGFSGAARYAPFVRYPKAAVYVADDIGAIAEAAKLKKVQSGANVTLLTPYDEGVFLGSAIVGADRLVSPLQVYLDLQSARARGEEAAEHLYQQKIEPLWSTLDGR